MVAACDVYDGRRDRAKEQWGSDLFTTREYHEDPRASRRSTP